MMILKGELLGVSLSGAVGNVATFKFDAVPHFHRSIHRSAGKIRRVTYAHQPESSNNQSN